MSSDIEKVVIGNATLYNGDCVQVTELVERVDHTITDPPYEAGAHTAFRQTNSGEGLVTKAHDFAAMDEGTRQRITELIVQRTKGWSLFFCQNEGAHYWMEALLKFEASYYATMVWIKPDGKPNFRGTGPGLGYESIVVGWCGEGKSSWNGGGKTGVFIHNKNEERTAGNIHTTIKPQKLMQELIGLFTNPGDVVFDPFMGSGSTGVATMIMGGDRKFIGVERDPKYFEICCRRMEDAQKGFFNTPYVKTRAKVVSNLLDAFKEPPKEKPVKEPKPPKEPKPAKEPKLVATKAPKPPPGPEKPAAVAQEATPGPVKRRLASPTIIVGNAAPKAVSAGPAPARFIPKPILPSNDGKLMIFDEATWDDPKPMYTGLDVETFHNFFIVNLKKFANGKRISFELSERSNLDKQRLAAILLREGLVTFNGMSYDMAMVYLALKGAGNHELKSASDHIIQTRIMPWVVEKELGIKIPKQLNHIDLFEPNPSIRQSLKTLNGRLHGKKMMDLPYEPEHRLTHMEMNVATLYCFNDIDATKTLFDAMKEPLLLRMALSKQYGMDMRSKSDAQVGEAIVKKRVEAITKKRIQKVVNTTTSFKYDVPEFLKFESEEINAVVDILRDSEFYLNYGKVKMPDSLKDLKIQFGDTIYKMGIGGLHSTEAHRAVHADDEYELEDIDVASQYPRIIMKLGMYPKALGPAFLKVYGELIDERLDAKELAKALNKKIKEGDTSVTQARDEAQVKAEGGKIALNGVFGKLGSEHSDLNGPHIMIAVTLTGQLSIFMFIEWLEKIGAHVVSANTDGVVVRYKRTIKDKVNATIAAWETSTGFSAERASYKSIYNSSVNTYIAIKEDGTIKRKGGIVGNPWKEKDLRGQMSKNPQVTICADAVVEFITKGTPIEETIRAATDVRSFVTVTNVAGGAKWREGYLAKVVRYYWSTDGDPILYSKASSHGTFKKVSNTDGAKPLMELPDSLPDDIDYERYIKEATDLAIDLAVIEDKQKWNLK